MASSSGGLGPGDNGRGRGRGANYGGTDRALNSGGGGREATGVGRGQGATSGGTEGAVASGVDNPIVTRSGYDPGGDRSPGVTTGETGSWVTPGGHDPDATFGGLYRGVEGGGSDPSSTRERCGPVTFRIKLLVSEKHRNLDNLILIQKKLKNNMFALKQFLVDKEQFSFLHILGINLEEKTKSIFVECKVNSVAELKEFKKASTKLSNAFTKFANAKEMYKGLKPAFGLKFYLPLPDETYAEVLSMLPVEGEHPQYSLSHEEVHKKSDDDNVKKQRDIQTSETDKRQGSRVRQISIGHVHQNPNVQKTLMVYIPNPDKNYIGKVKLASDHCIPIHGKVLKWRSGNIYECAVEIPLERLKQDICYSYEVQSSSYSMTFTRFTYDTHFSEPQHISSAVVQRDIFQRSFELESVNAYLKDIIYSGNINVTNMKEHIMQIEVLLKPTFFKFKECQDVIQSICYDLKDHQRHQAVLCIIVIGNLYTPGLAKINYLDKHKAEMMLSQLKKYSFEDFPSSCQKYLSATCLSLSEICKGSTSFLVQYMANCYNVLEETQLNLWFDTSHRSLVASDSESDISAVKYLSINAINKLKVEKSGSAAVQQVKLFIHNLVTHTPLTVALQICQILNDPVISYRDKIVLETLETLFSLTHLEAKKMKDIKMLIILWDFVEQNCCSLVTAYQSKFEEAILGQLEYDGDYGIRRLLSTKQLFDTVESQTLLAEILSASKNWHLHSAFLEIMMSRKFSVCLSELSVIVFQTWFQTFTITHLVAVKKTKLKVMYEKMFRLLEVVPSQKQETILSELDHQVISFLEKQDAKEILEGLCDIEFVCPEHYIEMCVKHLKSVLQGNKKKLRLQEIFDVLQDYRGKLSIDTRLAAEAVCFVLESYCPLAETDSQFNCLILISQHQKVWISVLSSCGKYKYLIDRCSSYRIAKECIMKTIKLLAEHDIPYEFYKANLHEQKHRVLLYLNNNKRDIDKLLEENEKKLLKEKRRLDIINSVINTIGDNVSEGVPESFVSFLKEIQVLVNEFDQMKQSEYLARFTDVFLEQDVFIHCELSVDVVKSNVYWNIFKKNAGTLKIKVDKAEEANEDEALEGLCSLFGEISFDSRPRYSQCARYVCEVIELANKLYTDEWKNIQDNPEVDMKNVFETFVNCFKNINEEIKFAEKHLRHALSEDCKTCLIRLSKLGTMKTNVYAMESAVKAFGLMVNDDETFANAIHSFKQLLAEGSTKLTFREIGQQIGIVFDIAQDLDDSTTNILISVGEASSLIVFLRRILEEDIRNLIDAVEDISEQHVSESTVSALIEVKRFFKPLLSTTSEQTCRGLIQSIQKQVQNFEKLANLLPSKIDDCMNSLHNLISLYNNVANRGEQTKQIIQNIVKQGKFHFELTSNQKMCGFTASYTQAKSKQKVIHSKSALCDFRSRALLLMNSDRHTNEKSMAELDKYVNAINMCLDISDHIYELHASGHLKYPKYNKSVLFDRLNGLLQSLLEELRLWTTSLRSIRETFYLMNFIQGSNIHVLDRYLQKDDDLGMVNIILKFLHPDLTAEKLKREFSKHKMELDTSDDYNTLTVLGMALTSSYKSFAPFKRMVQATDDTEKRMTDIVEAGRLFVARIDEGNVLVVKTLLALYLRTSKRIPEPSEVLLCSKETTWSDVELLIGRCIGAYQFYGKETLFCIANVEILPSEIHFKLVEVLKNLDKNKNFQLAVICQGSTNHPFIDEFYENVSNVRPLSDETVRSIFLEVCPNVYTYTSGSAGLGKTCAILSKAKQDRKTVKTLHISGPILKRKLIERLRCFNIHELVLLHIDIGFVDNPCELDMFLFELVILKYAVADGMAIDLSTPHVCIEIANTINNSLRNSLQTAVSFQRNHMKWNNFRDYLVSKEINSPVQIVCHYLYSLEKHMVDKSDLVFSGDACVKPLPTKVCRHLLQKYFQLSDTFIVTNTCIGVLADQLKKLSNSAFFKTSRIRDMTSQKSDSEVKSSVVKALVEVSKELAYRSVDAYRSTQQQTLDSKTTKSTTGAQLDLAASAAKHVEHMIRWEDSNHLIYIFHNQNIQTISPMYRQLSLVPKQITDLFESQMKRPLCDFKVLKQHELQDVLQKVARTNPAPLPSEELVKLSNDYALTPDNLLKMALIILRIKARVPVLVMGETGCGKTSLIRYLAAICEVDFDVISIHAGVEESTILDKVLESNDKAMKKLGQERWVFLDEINTSEYIGLISDMLCHHTCLGRVLSPNLVLLSACNPYKLRSSKSILTSGLKGKVKTDALSRLVYRVLPLPEMLVDYVWDFGSLTENDEKMYIDRMIGSLFEGLINIHNLFVDLLSMSQKFSRSIEETTSSVSLRDIQRCKILTEWFHQTLLKKSPKVKMSYRSVSTDNNMTSIILALSHCYLSRFSDKDIRKGYLEHLEDVCRLHHFPHYTASYIQNVIKQEQRDILARMELPPGTAQNTALCENVFVVLVCILNRVPIFVVGKPGCSKSLSLQVIKSNLRGKDSKDEFFKTLPQLYCVSFQGSESSTSDGIIKVFEKAEKYQEANSTDDVLSVVILDEIGLAEISRFNPLKVLHNLLEPDGKFRPNVAVVGVSNWSLDASKMNRAIHLSRPEMDEDELYETAISISNSFQKEEKTDILKHMEEESYSFTTQDISSHLKNLSKSYTDYILALRFENFHGLRDYYSLIKYVAREFSCAKCKPSETEVLEVIASGIERNFGGLPAEREMLYKKFHIVPSKKTPVLDLVTENVTDPLARHLMIITTGESVLGIIECSLKKAKREKREILFGSQFEEDLTDDYNYRMLSRIILCMEQGIILILKDLESIYGSLYDMLNKNYTEIGKKKHCRVALGAYSNPICHVHEDFRCIVLVNEDEVDFTDPPFLNRFEKQNICFSDIIQTSQETIIAEAEKWIDDFSCVKGKSFTKEDSFPIYSKDMVVSYVIQIQETGERCSLENMQKDLMMTMKPDSILRSKQSCDEYIRNEADVYQDFFFSLPLHNGLSGLLHYQLNEGTTLNAMTIVFTNSNIHSRSLHSVTGWSTQVEKLGAFKSEKQLSAKLQQFWLESDTKLLFVQCSAIDDEKHIMLAKSVIERNRSEFLANKTDTNKCVYLIVHLDKNKGRSSVVSQINFLSGWKLVMLDSIESPSTPLPELCTLSLSEAVLAKRPLDEYIKDQLFWTFTRIKYYRNGRDVDSINEVLNKMRRSCSFIHIVEEHVCTWITSYHPDVHNTGWQEMVACDPHALDTSLTLVDALEKYIVKIIDAPLSKYIYQMELMGITDSYFVEDAFSQERRQLWERLLSNPRVFSIADIHDESGPETFDCQTDDLCLKMPFSLHVFKCVETTREEFLNSLTYLQGLCELDEDDDLPTVVMEKLILKQEIIILEKVPELDIFVYENWMTDYIDDFCNLISFDKCSGLERHKKNSIMKWILKQKVNLNVEEPLTLLTNLHTSFWSNSSLFFAQLQLFEVCQSNVLSEENSDWVENIIQELSSVEEHFSDEKSDQYEEENSLSVSNLQMYDDPQSEEDCITLYNREDFQDPQTGMQTGSDVLLNDKSEIESEQIESRSHELTFETDNLDEPVSVESEIDDLTTEKDVYENDNEKDEASVKENIVPDETGTNGQQTLEEDIVSECEDDSISECSSTTSGWSTALKSFSSEISDVLSLSDSSTEMKLVSLLCKQMFPTSQTLLYHGGLAVWQWKVTLLLRLAANVSDDPPSLHALRICNDIADELFSTVKANSIELETIAELLKNGKALDSTEIFSPIMQMLNDNLSDKRNECQRLFSNYILRCIALNPETKAVELFLLAVRKGKVPDTSLSYLKLPISTLLKSASEEFYINILQNPESWELDAETDFCVSMNEALKSYNDSEIISEMRKLVVDIFVEIYMDVLAEDENEEETDFNALFLNSQRCFDTVHGLSFLAGLAYCKAFINSVLLKDHEFPEERMSYVLPAFQFSNEDDVGKSLLIYFLKMLGLKTPIAKFWCYCKSITDKMPILKKLGWFDEDTQDVSQYTEMCPLKVHCPEAVDNVVDVIKTTEMSTLSEEWGKLLTKSRGSPIAFVSIYGAIMHHFYLPRVHSEIDDTKGMQAKEILEISEEQFNRRESIQLLKCLLGKHDFDVPDLMIHRGSSSTDFYISNALISLYVLLHAQHECTHSDQMSILSKCLLSPIQVKESFLPGIPESNLPWLNMPYGNMRCKVNLCTCKCGVRLCFREAEIYCINCGHLNSETEWSTQMSEDVESKTAFVTGVKENCVRQLSPVGYNILAILTKGCLLGSVALKHSVSKNLGDIGVPDDAVWFLWNDIEHHWNSILQIMNMEEYHLCHFFQAIFVKVRKFICEDISPLTTEKERFKWEETFMSLVDDVIKQKFSSVNEIYVAHHQNIGTYQGDFEGNIRELVDESEAAKEQNRPAVMDLLRLHGEPSMVNFLGEFYDQRDNYSFLQLVLQSHQDLLLPKHILAIVQWHLIVTSNVSYILKKQVCMQMTVTEFIHLTKDKEARETRRKRFEAFKKAWGELKDALTDSLLPIERFHGQTKLWDALIHDENSIVYKVLCYLVRIQNQFLDRSLAISHTCKSVQFLCRKSDASMITCVDVSKVNSKQLVVFNTSWDECFSNDSQSDLAYGCGRLIAYDFISMEKFLAVHLLNGKAYINMEDTLPRIIFTDELYRNFASLVKELRHGIEQVSIPNSMLQSIHSNHEKDPKMASDLLTHLGIIMALLKKTKGDPNMALIDYVDNWKAILTRALPDDLLPSPAISVKLGHIVALHEVLEEMSAGSIVDALEEEYRQRLDSDMESHFCQLVQKQLKLSEVVLGTMKRFIFRCLSVPEADSTLQMADYLSDESFWPIGIFTDGKIQSGTDIMTVKAIIPEGLMVSHVFSTIKFLDEEIEKKRSSDINMSQMAASFKVLDAAPTQSKGKKLQKKTRKLRNF